VLIYTTPGCSHCRRVKRMLERKGVVYREVDLSVEPHLAEEMVRRSGGRLTVPQVFIGERHVGGADDVAALDAARELDALLERA
jgi:glutaredoxin 3